ncbi:MAG: sarcosine oxidase subunit gamma, partial [Gammaproteobacteria bacterium]
DAPALAPEHGAILDLSHSRTHLRIGGVQAATLLNRHLPLDLREASFKQGAVASSALHHAGVTLWRSARGYELFIPRGFALSLWEILLESAAQFGAEITQGIAA